MKLSHLFTIAFLSLSAPQITACSLPGQTIQKYDTLVAADEKCNQKWADIEAQLQRRYDLIPNLVNTVKASAKFEESTLKAVMEAKNAASGMKLSGDDFANEEKMNQFQEAQLRLRQSMMVLQEAYPDLKASGQFRDILVSLEGTENRILRSREEYNKAVGSYNTELRNFTGKIINPLTGSEFKPRVYFSADQAAKSAPTVQF